ncbi:MAG: hypothetical protein J1F63_02485 [Oscillospiraceae bacterium]|nr:hypothetical protein [Oscillospiraceae bacterium]
MRRQIENGAEFAAIISKIADSQKLVTKKDRLTSLVNKYSAYLDDELSEDELTLVAAAAKQNPSETNFNNV